MIIEIQCMPRPSGTPEEPYAAVHAAISVIESAGVHYEVGALGTTVEGDPDVLWPLVRRVHEATVAAGATSSMSIVKIFTQTVADPVTMTSLTDRYR